MKEERAQPTGNSEVENKLSAKEKFISGFTAVKPFFKYPYIFRFAHTSVTGVAIVLG